MTSEQEKEENNRKQCLLNYYKKKYGEEAEKMMAENQAKKVGKEYIKPLGRPRKMTTHEYRETQKKTTLKLYYKKKYGDKADQMMALYTLKHSIISS